MHGHHLSGTYTDGDGRPRSLAAAGTAVVNRPMDSTTEKILAVRAALAGATGQGRPDLRMHLISAHASPAAAWRTEAELDEDHDHEHDGPCTIRNHPRDDRSWTRDKALAVLDEALEEDR